MLNFGFNLGKKSAGGGALVAATFDWLVGLNITLSNGDKTAKNTSTTGRKAASSVGKSTGKLYLEFVFDVSSSNNFCGLIFSTALAGDAPDEGCLYQSLGLVFKPGRTGEVTSPYTAATVNGSVVGIAVDIDTGLMWVAVNNTWMGDPAAGTGSHYTVGEWAIQGKTVHPMAGFSTTANIQTSLITLAADFNYSPPSGFSAWVS